MQNFALAFVLLSFYGAWLGLGIFSALYAIKTPVNKLSEPQFKLQRLFWYYGTFFLGLVGIGAILGIAIFVAYLIMRMAGLVIV